LHNNAISHNNMHCVNKNIYQMLKKNKYNLHYFIFISINMKESDYEKLWVSNAISTTKHHHL
ncbi:hypothetical protein T10_1983, partial [Trichinella papuae]